MRPRFNRSGFTLAETAIALLVISAGILSVFALFPVGLDNTRAASGDVEAGLFAGKVFDAFRARFGAGDWNAQTVTIDTSSNPYLSSDALISADGSQRSFTLTDSVGNTTVTLWYKLTPVISVSGSSADRIALTLTVWPQKVQPAAADLGRVFYTEIVRQVPL